MKKFIATHEDSTLCAVIFDSAMGGVILQISWSNDVTGTGSIVHMGVCDTYEAAEAEMREVFPNINWR